MTAPQPLITALDADSLTLGDVLLALDRVPGLAQPRRRDLKSCVNGVARLCGDAPGAIRLDFTAIRSKLETVSPVACKISPKRFANLKWGFAYAVKATGLLAVEMGRSKVRLTPVWKSFMERLPDRRSSFGLGRLAHFASGRGLSPQDVDDEVIVAMMEHVDKTSLRRNQRRLRRTATLVWNEMAARSPGLGLQRLVVPFSRQKRTRIKPDAFPEQFRRDEAAYAAWCADEEPEAADARDRRLAAATVVTLRGYINAAATSLIASGIAPDSLTGLVDLVSPEAVTRILRTRRNAAGGREDGYTFNVGLALMRIAREWAKLDEPSLAEIKKKVMKVRPPSLGMMTERNHKLLRSFDDPEISSRLRQAPDRLWREAMMDAHPSRRTLAKVQAALALAILTYMPIRLQNLVALTFDRHLFLNIGTGAISTLDLPAAEVKNHQALAFDIPAHIAQRLQNYRDIFAPKILGRRATRLFFNLDGSPKSDKALRYLIQTYMKQYVGVDFNPHAFRHLSAKVILTAHPGGHAIVKDVLGHRSLNTSLNYYVGIRTREAGLHMQRLLDEPSATARPRRLDHRRNRGGAK